MKERINIEYILNSNDAIKQLDKLSASYDEVQNSFVQMDKTAKESLGKTLPDATKKTNKPIKEQIGLVGKLEKKYAELQGHLKKAKTEKGIASINKELKKTERELSRLKKVGTESLDNIGKKTSMTGKLFGELSGMVAGAFAVGAVIQFTKEVAELTDETNNAAQSIKTLFDLKGNELNETVKQSIVTAKTYGVETKDLIESTKVLESSFSDTGLTAQEAFKLVDSSFEKGANTRGEFLNILKEYPTQLKSVGLTAKESLAVITQTEQMGIFSDKGIDAIKEAGLRIREMTPATKAALQGIGLDAQEIQNGLENGTTSILDVIKKVSGKLNELPENSSAVGTAIADIFGGPGEDAGLTYLKTLKDINTDFDSLQDKSTELTKAHREFTRAWVELSVESTRSGGIISKVYSGILKFATYIINYVKEYSKAISPFINEITSAFKGIFYWIGKLLGRFDIFSGKINKTGLVAKIAAKWFGLLTSGLRWSLKLIEWLLAKFNEWIDSSPKIQAAIKSVNDWIDKLSKKIKQIPAYFAGMKAAAITAWKGMLKAAKEIFPAIGDIISGTLTLDFVKLTSGLAKAKTAMNNYGSDIGKAFTKAFDDELKKIDIANAVTQESEKKTKKTTNKNKPTGGSPINRKAANIQTLQIKTEVLPFNIKDKINEQMLAASSIIKKQTNKWKEFFKEAFSKNNAQGNIENIRTMAESVVDIFQQIADANIEVANKTVESKQNEVEQLETELDRELRLNEQGFASNVQLKQKELAEAKKQQASALAQKRAAQQAEERIEKARQISAIVTAIAQLIQQWTSLFPPFGHIAGLLQVGVMIAGFASSKAKAKKLRKGATGIVPEGLIRGASHEAGGVPFTPYEVEGGEYHSITPKKQAKKYLPILEAIRTDNTKVLRQHFEMMFPDAEINHKVIHSIAERNMSEQKNISDYKDNLSRIERLLKQQLNTPEIFISNGYMIEKKGNNIKRIKLNE